MKKTRGLFEKLSRLAHGEQLAASSLRGEWFQDMVDDGVLIVVTHGSHKSLRALNGDTVRLYVAERYGVNDIEEAEKLLSDGAIRAQQVAATGDSKFIRHRTFQGFLVNTLAPFSAQLNGHNITLQPIEGTFTFISDYTSFRIPADAIIVGVENAENFRYLSQQRPLFREITTDESKLLFVSRYPQEQSNDLMRWLLSINNPYIHFGDLDLAGVNIYLTEYFSHLGSRASFLIPSDYESRIARGSRERYTAQMQRFGNMVVSDPRVKPLLDCIHRNRRGYDQEGYISVE
ncbi:MAG: hypothetical protein ACOYJG_01405 [Prevotella sp.]|jgi:hypothetical protein